MKLLCFLVVQNVSLSLKEDRTNIEGLETLSYILPSEKLLDAQ